MPSQRPKEHAGIIRRPNRSWQSSCVKIGPTPLDGLILAGPNFMARDKIVVVLDPDPLKYFLLVILFFLTDQKKNHRSNLFLGLEKLAAEIFSRHFLFLDFHIHCHGT